MNGNDGHSAKQRESGNAIVTRAFGDAAEKDVNAASRATNFQVNFRSVAEGADEEAKMNDEDNDEQKTNEGLGTDNGMVNRGKWCNFECGGRYQGYPWRLGYWDRSRSGEGTRRERQEDRRLRLER